MTTCALWDIDRVPRIRIHFKTWSHPPRQSKPSILMLYIPLTVLIHQVMVTSCAGH